MALCLILLLMTTASTYPLPLVPVSRCASTTSGSVGFGVRPEHGDDLVRGGGGSDLAGADVFTNDGQLVGTVQTALYLIADEGPGEVPPLIRSLGGQAVRPEN